MLSKAHGSPVKHAAAVEAVAWEVVLKATSTKLDAAVVTQEINGVTVYEFTAADDASAGRLLVSLDAFTTDTSKVL